MGFEIRYDGFILGFDEDGDGLITVYEEDTGKFLKIIDLNEVAYE